MTEPTRQVWEDGQRLAMKIILRHKDLFRHVPALSDILFVIDTAAEPTSMGRNVAVRLTKVAGKVIDFIDAGAKTYMLEWFSSLTKELTNNQQMILLAEELLRFIPDGDGAEKIGGYDIVGRSEIREKFGLNPYSLTRGEVPDILADDFEWGPKARERIQFYHMLDRQQNRPTETKPAFRQTTMDEYMAEQTQSGEAAGVPTPDVPTLAFRDGQHFEEAMKEVVRQSGARVLDFPPGGRQTGTN